MTWDNAPFPLRSLIEGKSAQSFHQTLNQSTPAMQQALQQILNCPYQGVLKQFALLLTPRSANAIRNSHSC
ncbi:hypothetical protein [Nostoc sp. CALU 546]